jgi:hypothetical protein
VRQLGRDILFGMERPCGQLAQRQLCQQLADAAFVIPRTKVRLQPRLQIAAAPTHNAISRKIRSGLNKRLERHQLLGRQLRLTPRAATVRQARKAFGVVMMHPIPQGLPVHTAPFCRRRPGLSFQHHGDRQQTPDHRTIAAPRRLTAKLRR